MTEVLETTDLIGSDKVEGTNVFASNGEKMGSIERVMLGKKSGKIAYAVLSFGGFLGFGHDHYPLPWATLTYDENLGGYRTAVTQAQLEGAPKFASDADWSWNAHARSVDDYYGVPIGEARAV
jgi:hypothetical protein